MDKIAIVFEGHDQNLAEGFPFNSAEYFPSYQRFIETGASQGLEIRITYHTLYQGKSTFSGSFILTPQGKVWDPNPFTPKLIHCKTGLMFGLLDGSETTINRKEIFTLASSKRLTYERFSQYMLKTIVLQPETWEQQLNEIPGDWVVCKPETGHGGFGIFVGAKADFKLPEDTATETYLLQEFLDTSEGIPGVTKGVHDLRIILSGYEPLSYARIPKPGSLLANLHQGGEARALKTSEIPETALAIARKLEQELSPDFPHFYCADFLFSPEGKPFLCEFNSQPGFAYDGGEGPEFVARYHQTLLNVFKDTLALIG